MRVVKFLTFALLIVGSASSFALDINNYYGDGSPFNNFCGSDSATVTWHAVGSGFAPGSHHSWSVPEAGVSGSANADSAGSISVDFWLAGVGGDQCEGGSQINTAHVVVDGVSKGPVEAISFIRVAGTAHCSDYGPVHAWGSYTITVPLGGTVYSLKAIGTVTANGCNGPHTIQLKIGGSVVATGSTSGNGSPNQVGSVVFNSADNYTGQSYQWLVDGVVQGSGVIEYQTNAETGVASSGLSFGDNISCTTPTPTPAPSASPSPHVTPTPYPTPAPTPANPPGSTPFPGASPGATPATIGTAGGNGEGVVVLNPSDIYEPIIDSQKVTGTVGTPDTHLDNADLSNEGHIADIQGAITDARDIGGNVVSAASQTELSGVAKINALLAQLQSVGSSHVIDVAVPSAGGLWNGYTWHIDLSAWSAPIAVFRAFVLICCVITYGFLTLRAMTYQN